MVDRPGSPFRLFLSLLYASGDLEPPLHDTEMTVKGFKLVVAWFWHIWHLLCSFAVLTKRRPPLPRSASHPELEKGLFTFGASGGSRQGPSVKQRGGGDHSLPSQDESTRAINILDFQFTFENKPNAVSGGELSFIFS